MGGGACVAGVHRERLLSGSLAIHGERGGVGPRAIDTAVARQSNKALGFDPRARRHGCRTAIDRWSHPIEHAHTHCAPALERARADGCALGWLIGGVEARATRHRHVDVRAVAHRHNTRRQLLKHRGRVRPRAGLHSRRDRAVQHASTFGGSCGGRWCGGDEENTHRLDDGSSPRRAVQAGGAHYKERWRQRRRRRRQQLVLGRR